MSCYGIIIGPPSDHLCLHYVAVWPSLLNLTAIYTQGGGGRQKRDLQLIFLHRWLMHHIFLIVQDLLLKVKLAVWRISTFFHMYTEQGLLCSWCHFLYYTHVTLSPLVLMQVWLGLQRKCKQTGAVSLISADLYT